MWLIKTPTFSAILAVLAVSALAADNQDDIDVILRVLLRTTDKADQDRQRAIETSRASAISKLVKLAELAYRDGDRVAETNAWKTVISLDRQHDRARKYFSDLGTLDMVLAELPTTDGAQPPTIRNLVGKWKTRYKNEKTAEFTVHANGVVRYAFQGNQPADFQLKIEHGSMILPIPSDNVVERWTLAGEKLLIEQWHPRRTYDPAAPASAFGYAVRLEK